MKNLTLRIDESALAEARKQAAERGTTLAKLVRSYIMDLAGRDVETPEARQARRELVEMARASKADFGPNWKWRREEAYDAPRFSRHERSPLRGDNKSD
jgi:hypothetical protein